jgi:hypothetical protein
MSLRQCPKPNVGVHAMQSKGTTELGPVWKWWSRFAGPWRSCVNSTILDRLVTVSSHPRCIKYNTPFYPYTCSTTPSHWPQPGGYPPWQSLVRLPRVTSKHIQLDNQIPTICHPHDVEPSTNTAVTRLYGFAGHRRHWAGQAAVSARSAFCSTSLSNPPFIGSMTCRWLSNSDGSVIFFRSLSKTDSTGRLRHLVW